MGMASDAWESFLGLFPGFMSVSQQSLQSCTSRLALCSAGHSPHEQSGAWGSGLGPSLLQPLVLSLSFSKGCTAGHRAALSSDSRACGVRAVMCPKCHLKATAA